MFSSEKGWSPVLNRRVYKSENAFLEYYQTENTQFYTLRLFDVCEKFNVKSNEKN